LRQRHMTDRQVDRQTCKQTGRKTRRVPALLYTEEFEYKQNNEYVSKLQKESHSEYL